METLIQLPDMRAWDGSQLYPSPGIALTCRNQSCSSLVFSLGTAHIHDFLLWVRKSGHLVGLRLHASNAEGAGLTPGQGNWDPTYHGAWQKKKILNKRCDNPEWAFQLPNSPRGQLQPGMNLLGSSTPPLPIPPPLHSFTGAVPQLNAACKSQGLGDYFLGESISDHLKADYSFLCLKFFASRLFSPCSG